MTAAPDDYLSLTYFCLPSVGFFPLSRRGARPFRLTRMLSTGVFENVYCCGNDLASLCPRFISVKRGFYICLVGSAVINPWYLLGSASIFITVLSSYQIFLFSIAAIIMVDYFAVSKGLMIYEDLYTTNKLGTYCAHCCTLFGLIHGADAEFCMQSIPTASTGAPLSPTRSVSLSTLPGVRFPRIDSFGTLSEPRH